MKNAANASRVLPRSVIINFPFHYLENSCTHSTQIKFDILLCHRNMQVKVKIGPIMMIFLTELFPLNLEKKKKYSVSVLLLLKGQIYKDKIAYTQSVFSYQKIQIKINAD